MKLEKLACNSCGAPLEVPESANFVTCNHCSTQLAVNRSDSVTVPEEIEHQTGRTEELADRVVDLAVQNEIDALDYDWGKERFTFTIRDKEGNRHIPTESEAIGDGILGGFLGASTIAVGVAFSLIGKSDQFTIWSIVGLGIGMVLFGFVSMQTKKNKAQGFKIAEYQYRKRREKLFQQLEQ